MRASVFVGRVGGLAVALGIGAAAGCLTSGVAGASPDDSTDSSARSEATAAVSTREGSSGSGLRSRLGRSAAQEASSGGRESGGVKGARGPAVKNDPDSATESGRLESDGLASVSPAESVLSPVRVSTEVVGDRLIRTTASVPFEVIPAASAIVSPVPWVAGTVADAPVMAPAAAAAGVVEAVDGGWSGSVPGGPGESAASWVMVAATRRETGRPAAAQNEPSVAVPSGSLLDVEAAIVDQTTERPARPAPAAVGAPGREASATVTISLKDKIDIEFSGLNSSIGWIPLVGTAINGVKFVIDAVSLVSSVFTLDFVQVITEVGNLIVDTIGLVPVVGAPIAALLSQTVLGVNVKLGALVQESLQTYFDSDSVWSEDQFHVDAVDVSVALGGSHPSIATVSKPNHAGVGVLVDVTNTGFESGWSLPLEGRLQLLALAWS